MEGFRGYNIFAGPSRTDKREVDIAKILDAFFYVYTYHMDIFEHVQYKKILDGKYVKSARALSAFDCEEALYVVTS